MTDLPFKNNWERFSFICLTEIEKNKLAWALRLSLRERRWRVKAKQGMEERQKEKIGGGWAVLIVSWIEIGKRRSSFGPRKKPVPK